MASEAPRADQEQSTDGIKDPTDYKQRRRIESILDARAFVLAQRNNALDMEVYGEINSRLADRIVRAAVEQYVYESEHKIKEHLPKDGKDESGLSSEEQAALDVWLRLELGSIPMYNDEYEIVGLSGYINAPDVIQEEVVVTESHAIRGESEETKVLEYEVPREISLEAYRALNYFWGVLGMDVDMQDKLNRVSLIEEEE